MNLVVSSNVVIVSWYVGWLDTHDGIVGKLFVGLVRGSRLLDTGMWSEVVASFVRGCHVVFVCGCRSRMVEVKMLVYIRSIRESDIVLCRVGSGW